MTKQAMLAEIERLPVEDRLDLVEAIWDGVASEAGAVKPSELQLRELRRRLAVHDADPSTAISSEEMDALLATLRTKK